MGGEVEKNVWVHDKTLNLGVVFPESKHMCGLVCINHLRIFLLSHDCCRPTSL